jgi:phosphatidylserine/phosphatidylglycerophosphate/cardiolipin synthase-like enzyme
MIAPSPIGVGLANSLIEKLAGDYGAAAQLARVIAARAGGVMDQRSISIEPRARFDRIARDFVDRRWITPEGAAWRRGPLDIPLGVPSFLEGAAALFDALPDNGTAKAAVTMPAAPSTIAKALPTTGYNYANLISTDEALEKIAGAAIQSFTIMTPFLNQAGLSRALSMFNLSTAKNKILITRQSGPTARTLREGGAALAAASIRTLSYLIREVDGFETFHAKVALADEALAYVGSANMTVYDRHSMELGVMMDGHPARVVASVVRAVEQISSPIALPTYPV